MTKTESLTKNNFTLMDASKKNESFLSWLAVVDEIFRSREWKKLDGQLNYLVGEALKKAKEEGKMGDPIVFRKLFLKKFFKKDEN